MKERGQEESKYHLGDLSDGAACLTETVEDIVEGRSHEEVLLLQTELLT